MKKKSIIGLFIGLMGFGSMATSCEDMLTPDMDRYTQQFSGKDTVNFYLGIMANVQEMVEQNLILGEIRGDLADTTLYSSDSIADIANFQPLEDGDNALLNRSAYYKVINQCNFYLDKVDSLAEKNGIAYMQKETAQVLTIRAWTYMQLVQNYGTVPFITKPVDNANTGWETNSPEGTVNVDNLVDQLRGDLLRAISYENRYGYPQYGNFNTGSVNVSSNMMIFPANLVLGDLYLMRGNSKDDYVKAAQYYYEYMSDTKTANLDDRRASYSINRNGGIESYYPEYFSWINGVFTPDYVPSLRSMVAIPSAANSSFGKVLTRIPQMYGFDITSRNSTSVNNTTNSSGESEDVVTTSGTISLTPNMKTRQIGPSQSYIALNKAQLYKMTTLDNDNVPTRVEYYRTAGDARQWGSAPYVSTSDGRARYIQKFGYMTTAGETSYSTGGAFRYVLPVYRNELVYLRFAEAINRAGYPRHAFAILRNGLNSETVPKLRDSVAVIPGANEGDPVTYQTVYYIDSVRSVHDGCDYIGVDELRRAQENGYSTGEGFLNFTSSQWGTFAIGIHALGCAKSYDNDTIYTYEKVVAERIENEEALKASFGDLAQSVAKRDGESEDGTEEPAPVEPGEPGSSADNPLPAVPAVGANDAEINAVETLIADEMALETAFEGNRYYDLMRIARHKDKDSFNPANFGTNWFAWLISRRSMYLAPYEDVTVKGPLYGTLTNTSNWYLANPVY